MASSIAGMCTAAQLPVEVAIGVNGVGCGLDLDVFLFCPADQMSVAVGTTLVTCMVACATAGALTVGVGRARLAQYLQYIPLPVIGGYLGYVGYFCLAGGAGLAANVELNDLIQWLDVIHPGPLIKVCVRIIRGR